MPITKCLFPAAGYGTRFLPATKAMPKEMMPIVNKPLIEYGVAEAAEAGMTDICIITGRGKRAIEDHFDTSFELEHQIYGTNKAKLLEPTNNLIDQCTFTYTRQRAMKGLGDAILSGRKMINDAPFGVVLADDLCVSEGEGVLAQMTKQYAEHQCSIIGVMEVPLNEVSKYGVINPGDTQGDVINVQSMVEKPAPADAPSTLIAMGRYILSPEIFDVLENTQPGTGGEVQLTDALNTLAQQGKLKAYKFKGQRFDCGSIEGFAEATQYIFNTHFKGQNAWKSPLPAPAMSAYQMPYC